MFLQHSHTVFRLARTHSWEISWPSKCSQVKKNLPVPCACIGCPDGPTTLVNTNTVSTVDPDALCREKSLPSSFQGQESATRDLLPLLNHLSCVPTIEMVDEILAAQQEHAQRCQRRKKVLLKQPCVCVFITHTALRRKRKVPCVRNSGL